MKELEEQCARARARVCVCVCEICCWLGTNFAVINEVFVSKVRSFFNKPCMKVKVKVKVKAQWGSRGIAVLFL
jgi:hypothetical protein